MTADAKPQAWIRVRFTANADDPRPVTFPPPGPYWVSGYGSDDSATIVAYLRTEEQVREFWPEAVDVDVMQRDLPGITFTDRFSKPDWWTQ